MKKFCAIVFLLSACSAFTQAQRADSLAVKTDSLAIKKDSLAVKKDSLAVKKDSLAVKKDSLSLTAFKDFFTHEDSLSIFDLIDSLIKMGPLKENSMLAARLGYNSNIVADNRTLNISQFGLAPGASYYHKTGLYADFTAYASQEYSPTFYLSVASGGYMHTFTKWYSIIAEYSHYFYNQPQDSTVSVPYTNNLGLTNYFEFKRLILRLDYYFYFGQKNAHRLMPGLGLNLVKKKWAGFDRISFYPMVYVLFGTDQITTYEFYPNLLARYIYNRTHTPKLPLLYENITNEFGVMNYAISTPISFTKKDWTFLISYTYNIPKALPGEDLSLQNGGYLSFSITHYFKMSSRKKITEFR